MTSDMRGSLPTGLTAELALARDAWATWRKSTVNANFAAKREGHGKRALHCGQITVFNHVTSTISLLHDGSRD